jgi:2,4-dienoyl-CoA reductase-like NADH-dependent reductase (Old Yellow Enzyme family)
MLISKNKEEAILVRSLDLVYVGRLFIANPNFADKLQNNMEVITPDLDTFYSQEKNDIQITKQIALIFTECIN